MNTEARFQFVCPDCEVTVAVDTAKRTALLAVGCVRCGAPVDDGAFATA
ncbi:hypothetical protein ACFPYI_09740 [Halomarina salina]|uniref:Small CPxCG-related zinc finger protein n=1 Tax=Halomarina salina TaxID=1872699 RepID=A0ABD5RMN3_9EURY|nr:hypothetical protein [Halomarina salina]